MKDKIRIAENFDLPDDVADELEKGGGPLFLRLHKVRLLLDTQIALSVTTRAPRKRGLSDEADAVFRPPVSAWEASDRMAACRHVTSLAQRSSRSFDRMLVCQAMTEPLRLVMTDKALASRVMR